VTQQQPGAADELIAANVRRLREHAAMSQAALAQAMSDQGHGWHQQTVYKVENGTRPLRAAELLAVAAILNVGLDRFTWTGAEANGTALVYDAAATLRARRYELILATRALLAARGRAERILATSAASEYQRVREACAELAADLEECDPDGAVDEGIARHESPEEED
jgi:transcriptional regulator with XRE-family HTH domain